jgi:hypothetical protein
VTEHNRQSDDSLPQISDRLRKDLRDLFEPPGAVSPKVDEVILNQARRCLAKPRRFILRLRWATGVAACLAIAVLGWWVVLNLGVLPGKPDHSAALPGEDMRLVIELASAGGRIAPGATIQTSAGETKSVVLNNRHQVVLNAGTELSIEPLAEMGRAGCLVNLVLGEVYVHVEHDGNPFVVQTAHSRAIITGTTFDVKATDTGTTLVVAEGSVRFESEGGAVQVIAGQRSMITATSAPPSTPTACDAIALTVWTKSGQDRTQVAQDVSADDLGLHDLPLFPSPGTRTDLKSVSYSQWVEQNRDWFQRQFPDVFRLKGALTQDGIEADYFDLLLESAVVWQFAYPPASQNRLLVVEDEAITKAANRYGKDLQWLKDRGMLPVATTAANEQKRMAEAFTLWQKELDAVESGKEVPKELLLSSLHACIYLRQMRSLIWLAANTDRYSLPKLPKAELQALLEAEVVAADDGVSDVIQLLATDRSILACDSDPYRQLVRSLYETITQMTQTEERLADEMANSHP